MRNLLSRIGRTYTRTLDAICDNVWLFLVVLVALVVLASALIAMSVVMYLDWDVKPLERPTGIRPPSATTNQIQPNIHPHE